MSRYRQTLGHNAEANKPVTDAHAFLLAAGQGKSIRTFQKNQEIFIQGQRAHEVFYLQHGRVKVTATSEQGKIAVVGVLVPGQFFGEACLAGHHSRLTTATAMEECFLTSIAEGTMRAALRTEPEFSETFMAYLLSHKSRIEDDLIDQLFNSSEKRLARLLLLLANYGKEGVPPVISVTVTQEMLAEMIGTTRSRVSFFMNKFRRAGYISYVAQNGTITVHMSLLDSVLRETPAILKE
jgi:CRP-like cAMP-binding protein